MERSNRAPGWAAGSPVGSAGPQVMGSTTTTTTACSTPGRARPATPRRIPDRARAIPTSAPPAADSPSDWRAASAPRPTAAARPSPRRTTPSIRSSSRPPPAIARPSTSTPHRSSDPMLASRSVTPPPASPRTRKQLPRLNQAFGSPLAPKCEAIGSGNRCQTSATRATPSASGPSVINRGTQADVMTAEYIHAAVASGAKAARRSSTKSWRSTPQGRRARSSQVSSHVRVIRDQ